MILSYWQYPVPYKSVPPGIQGYLIHRGDVCDVLPEKRAIPETGTGVLLVPGQEFHLWIDPIPEEPTLDLQGNALRLRLAADIFVGGDLLRFLDFDTAIRSLSWSREEIVSLIARKEKIEEMSVSLSDLPSARARLKSHGFYLEVIDSLAWSDYETECSELEETFRSKLVSSPAPSKNGSNPSLMLPKLTHEQHELLSKHSLARSPESEKEIDQLNARLLDTIGEQWNRLEKGMRSNCPNGMSRREWNRAINLVQAYRTQYRSFHSRSDKERLNEKQISLLLEILKAIDHRISGGSSREEKTPGLERWEDLRDPLEQLTKHA